MTIAKRISALILTGSLALVGCTTDEEPYDVGSEWDTSSFDDDTSSRLDEIESRQRSVEQEAADAAAAAEDAADEAERRAQELQWRLDDLEAQQQFDELYGSDAGYLGDPFDDDDYSYLD